MGSGRGLGDYCEIVMLGSLNETAKTTRCVVTGNLGRVGYKLHLLLYVTTRHNVLLLVSERLSS